MPRKYPTHNSSAELLRAQAHVWNHIFNFINSMSLKCAIQLGIIDAIHCHGHPISLPELVAALPAIEPTKAQSCLPRLMNILVHSGFFAKTNKNGKEEAYTLTPASHLLLKDNPVSLRPFLLAMLDPVLTEPWQFLGTWFQNSDQTAFETNHGGMFWEYVSDEPRFNGLFNDAMASDAHLVMQVVLKERSEVFDGVKTLVDVGGGTGVVAQAISSAFPEMKCTVLDLPHVIDGLQSSKNLEFVAGDMFEAIPQANAALLKWILHDWSDEDSKKILKQCKEAIPRREEGGKVIIIDMVIDSHCPKEVDHHYHEYVHAKLFSDMLMMTVAGGKERKEEEWAKLFSDAGFSDYKIIPLLGIRAVIEVYP